LQPVRAVVAARPERGRKPYLVEKIFEQMGSDDANTDKQSATLLNIWNEATAEQKEALNDAMICICGWTMGSLIEMVNQSQEGNP